jgi:hypothetical protein
MKPRYHYGISKDKVIVDDDPVLPGCFKYEERLQLKNERPYLSPEEFEARRKEIFDDVEFQASSPDMITMYLKHGDMMVMHGEEMQKYYEVSFVF